MLAKKCQHVGIDFLGPGQMMAFAKKSEPSSGITARDVFFLVMDVTATHHSRGNVPFGD